MTLPAIERVRELLPHSRASALLEYLAKIATFLPHDFGTNKATPETQAGMAQWVRSPLESRQYPQSAYPMVAESLLLEIRPADVPADSSTNARILFAASLLLWLWSEEQQEPQPRDGEVLIRACTAAHSLGFEAVMALLEFITCDRVWPSYTQKVEAGIPAFVVAVPLLMNALAVEIMREVPEVYTDRWHQSLTSHNWTRLRRLTGTAGACFDVEVMKRLKWVTVQRDPA